MPIDVDVAMQDSSPQPTEANEQNSINHAEVAQTIVDDLTAKGMTPTEIQAYVTGKLDSGVDVEDKEALEIVLNKYIESGLEELETHANSEIIQQVPTKIPVQVHEDAQNEYDEDPILARTASPSGKPLYAPTKPIEPETFDPYELHRQFETQQAADLDQHVQTEVEPALDDGDSEPPQEGGDGEGGGDDNNDPPTELTFRYGRANVEEESRNLAHMYAETKIADDLEEGGFFRKMVKRAFKGNIARQYYYERYRQEYQRRVDEAGGQIYAPIEQLYGKDSEESQALSDVALQATLERLMSEDPRMRREGENAQSLTGNPELDDRVRDAIQDLTLRYARGELDDDTILNERDRLFGEIEGLSEEFFGDGINTIDNMLELARDVRAEVEHSEGLDRVEAALAELDLRGFRARSTIDTELKQTIFDRISQRVGTSRIGGTAIASSIVLGAAIVFCGTKRGAQSGVGAALRLTGIGAAASGAIAAGNEYAAFRREATYQRMESAYGIERDATANFRRRELQEIVYASESVPAAIDEMRAYLAESGGLREDVTTAGLLDAEATIVRLRTLLDESEARNADLLQFSGVSSAAIERLDLLQTIVELEGAIDARVGDGTQEVEIQSAEGLTTTTTLGEALSQQRAATIASLETDIAENVTARDEAYRRLMTKRVAKAFVAGSVVGAAWGAALQEVAAAVNPGINGVFETQNPGQPNTLLNSLIFGQHNGSESVQPPYGGGNHLITHSGSPVKLEIPSGLEAQYTTSHSVNLINKSDGSVVLSNLEFNSKGELTPQSVKLLDTQHISHAAHGEWISGKPKTVSSSEFYQANKNQLVHMKPTLMMNDTHVADLNELHMYAAGHEGSWFDSKGNVRIRVDGISPNGSFQTPESVNPVEALKGGHLKVFMSIDKKHGLDVFAFTVKQQGDHYEVVIPKSNPAHQLFGKGNGNLADAEGFLGRYLGTAVDRGTNARGVHDYAVINSIEGTPKDNHVIPVRNRVTTTRLGFPPITTEEGGTLPVFGPPIYARRGVGAPQRTPDSAPDYTYSGDRGYEAYRQLGDEEIQSIRADASPRMLAGEQLDLSTDIEWYRDQLKAQLGDTYVTEIDTLVESASGLKNLSPKTKALVTIPVAAAVESENIYNTLSLYSQQERVDPGEFSIVLGVNNIEGQRDDSEVLAKIEKTLAEIARAQADFPELTIIVVNFEIPQSLVEQRRQQPAGPGIIGDVMRRLYDVTAFASAEHVAKPDSEQKDILIIRNDADMIGLSPVYVDRMLKGMQTMPTADAYRGDTQFGATDEELASRLPGLSLSMGLEAFLVAQHAGSPDRLNTAGANFAVRASSFVGMGGLSKQSYAGAGSDDLDIGRRLKVIRYSTEAARKRALTGSYGAGYGQGSPTEASTPDDIDLEPVRFVGAGIDTNPARQVAPYLDDKNPALESWSGFSDSPTGAKPRTADMEGRKVPKESLGESIRRSETFIGQLMRGMDRAEAEVLLSRFFGETDRCRVIADSAGKLIGIQFTKEGRTFLKGVFKRKERALEKAKGVFAAKSRRYMRRGKSPRLRYVRANNR